MGARGSDVDARSRSLLGFFRGGRFGGSRLGPAEPSLLMEVYHGPGSLEQLTDIGPQRLGIGMLLARILNLENRCFQRGSGRGGRLGGSRGGLAEPLATSQTAFLAEFRTGSAILRQHPSGERAFPADGLRALHILGMQAVFSHIGPTPLELPQTWPNGGRHRSNSHTLGAIVPKCV